MSDRTWLTQAHICEQRVVFPRKLLLVSCFLVLGSCVWQADYEKLGREKSQLALRLQALEEDLSQKTRQERELRADLEQHIVVRRRADERFRQGSEELARARQELRTKDGTIEKLTQRIQGFQTSLDALRRRAAAADTESRAQIAGHLDTIAALQGEQAAAQKSIAELTIERDSARRAALRTAELQRTIQTLEAQVQQLAREGTSLRSQNALLGQKVTELAEATEALTRERDRLTGEIAALAATVAQRDLQMGELQKRAQEGLAAHTRERDRLTGEIAALATTVAQRDLQMAELQRRAQEGLAAHTRERDRLTGEIAALAATVAQRDLQMAELQRQSATLVTARDQLATQLAAATMERDTLTEQLTEVTRTLHKNKEDSAQALAALTATKDALQMEQRVLSDQLVVATREREAAAAKLAAATQALERNQGDKEQAVQALAAMQDQMRQGEAQTQRLKEEYRVVQNELGSLKETAKQLEEGKLFVEKAMASQQEQIAAVREELIAQPDTVTMAEVRGTIAAKFAEISGTSMRCAQLGVVSSASDKNCDAYETVLGELREAPLAYNRPGVMLRDRRTEIVLVVDPTKSPEPESPLRDKDLEGEIVVAKTRIARHMSAELKGTAFDVEPQGAQQKLLTATQPLTFTWFVTATEAGDKQPLTLDVYVHIQEDEKISPPIPIRTFRDRIFVDVTTWDRIKDIVTEVEPIHASLVAIGGSLSGLLGFFIGRRRKGNTTA